MEVEIRALHLVDALARHAPVFDNHSTPHASESFAAALQCGRSGRPLTVGADHDDADFAPSALHRPRSRRPALAFRRGNYLRPLLLLRAFDRCFLPGGPPELPRGMLL